MRSVGKDKEIMTAIIRAVVLFLMVIALTGCQGEAMEPAGIQEDSREPEARIPGQTRLVVATDVHHLATSLKDDGQAFESFIKSGDGKLLHYTDELMEVLVADVKVKQADIVVISGDLTNNGEKASHQELATYLEEMEEAGIQAYVIPGNHDINNPFALGFEGSERYRAETTSPEEFAQIYGDFGYHEAISRDPNSLSYLVQPTEDLALLMLDSNKYQRNLEIGLPDASGEIGQETLVWIENTVADLQGKDVIAVMHHNAMVHTDMFVENYVIDNSKQVLDLFEELGIQLVLSGHIHIQDLARDERTGIAGLTTSSMSVYPHRFGVMTITDQDYSYQTSDLQVGLYAERMGWTNPDLLDFQAFSKASFADQAESMFTESLSKDLPEDQLSDVVDVVVALNLAYFAGETLERKGEISQMKGFEAMLGLPNSFMKFYMNSILADTRDDNQWQMKKGVNQ